MSIYEKFYCDHVDTEDNLVSIKRKKNRKMHVEKTENVERKCQYNFISGAHCGSYG